MLMVLLMHVLGIEVLCLFICIHVHIDSAKTNSDSTVHYGMLLILAELCS